MVWWILGGCAMGVFLYAQNNLISRTELTITTDKLKSAITIVHISDLHDKELGRDNRRLLSKIRAESPDIIVVTGDLCDRYATETTVMLNFCEMLTKIATVYYCTGNHDYCRDFNFFHSEISRYGVHTLIRRGESVEGEFGRLNILGLDEIGGAIYTKPLMETLEKEHGFRLVLSHYPHCFEKYAEYDVDLVLCGHAHGGQFFLPFIGGLFAPHQGLFPKYCRGMHHKNDVTLIVNRGVGNSGFPFRLFNFPDMGVIRLLPG